MSALIESTQTESSDSEQGRNVLAWLLLSAIWGASFLFIRVAVTEVGPFPLMAARVLIASVAIHAVVRARGLHAPIRPYARRLLLLGLVHAAAPYALIAAAEVKLEASTACVLISVQPLWTAGLAVALGKERAHWTLPFGLLLGIAGVAVLVGWRPDATAPASAWSVVAMLLAAGLYAGGSLYAKYRMADVPVLPLTLGQQLAAACWLAIPAAATFPTALPTPRALVAVVALALVCTALAYALFFRLIERIGAVRTSTVTYAIPAFGVGFGALFLGETPSTGLVGGLALILGGLFLTNGLRLATTRRARRRCET
ncbi:MAG: DMT family transporter [Candidatus Eisenbacteria bacterium]|uniref:DMT family transporter n=1 Tax=Eiseniibacteriota bacterium TaxID=2212470 RepID=A0A956NBN3_UNCEI|nr:DMT family transporter [Candidatus Eisenbacteria bacterium]